ncbi:MAG TPA: lipopolysaccharide heptosyltransferase II [Deltaproteobacteria bacterium]|nr:lipopolysaccharide heptosyltransferase II [Deltaproteobacteria bacterium]
MKNLNLSSLNKVLIRAVNWAGDAVMTTPAIGAIRGALPKAEITLLANPLVSELFSPHPWIDHVITFDRKALHSGITGRLRLAAELRKQHFDAALILPNSFDSALVPWLAGIPVRLGKSSDGRGFMLTGRYRLLKEAAGCHEVEYYLDLVRHFGISGQDLKPQLFTTSDEAGHAKEQLQQHGISPDDFVIGINPGATYGSAKRWYPDRFAEAARALAAEWNAKILIFGGPSETAMAGDIEQALHETFCLNMAGKTTVRELMALIQRCNFFLTNDSGPMHIAAAFGVPLVAIFGSTDHTGTAPYTDNAVIVRKPVACAPCKLRECPTDHICMKSVTAQDVIQASLELLQRTKDCN